MDPTQPKHNHKSTQETAEEKLIEGITVVGGEDIGKWCDLSFPLVTEVHRD